MLWILCVQGIYLGVWIRKSLAASQEQYSVLPSSARIPSISPFYINSTGVKIQSYDQIPEVYVPLPAEERGACSITDKYCSYNGTARNPDGLRDQCLLWDDICSGNETLAIEEFFNQTQGFLYNNICFTADGYGSVQSNCTTQNTPARFAEFSRIKSWMRSSGCIVSQSVYQKAHPTPDTEGMQGEKRDFDKRDNSTGRHKIGGGTCCGMCNVEAGNVDVYYWPSPNANDSCLSTIGNSINPPDYGATTDSLGLR